MTFTLIHGAHRPPMPVDAEPHSVWRTPEGEITTTFHRTASGCLVRVNDCADYAIDFVARTITCNPCPESTEDLVQGTFTNQIEPLLRTWDGDLVLHASAVSIEGRAVGFFGLSRRGKSTLATAFSQKGHPCVTDDGLILLRTQTGFLAEPRKGPLRLLPDSEAALVGAQSPTADRDSKARIVLPDEITFQKGPIALGSLYHLGEPGAKRLAIGRLDRTEAMDLAIKQTFMLDIGDKARMRAHFDSVAFLVETVPIFSLDYPRDYRQLRGVLERIVAHVRKTGEST